MHNPLFASYCCTRATAAAASLLYTAVYSSSTMMTSSNRMVLLMLCLPASASFAFMVQPLLLKTRLQHGAHSRAPASPAPARGSSVTMLSLVPSSSSSSSSRDSSSRGHARSPVLRSTAEVLDVVSDDGDASSPVVVDEFDVKTNLLKKIDLSSSRRMRWGWVVRRVWFVVLAQTKQGFLAMKLCSDHIIRV